MKKYLANSIVLFFIIMMMSPVNAQIDGGLLFGLINATTTEMNNVSNPVQGSLLYNTTESAIFKYDGSAWEKVGDASGNWNTAGNTGLSSTTNFLGTTDAQDMVLKANNQERLLLSSGNQTVRVNQALQYGDHPFIIRANGNNILAFQDALGTTKWHWNILGNGLNFVETGVLDYRLFLQNGGGVGIDTGSPTEKLDINGSVRIRDITTTTSDLDVLVTTNTGVVQKRAFADFISGTGVTTTTIKVDQSYIWSGNVNDSDIHSNTLQQTRADTGWGFSSPNTVTYTGSPDYIEIDLMAVANNTGNHWAHPHIKIFRNGQEIGEGSGLHMDDSSSYSGRTTTVISMIDSNPGTNPVYTFRTYEDDNRTMNNPTISQLSPVSLAAINKIDVVVSVTSN